MSVALSAALASSAFPTPTFSSGGRGISARMLASPAVSGKSPSKWVGTELDVRARRAAYRVKESVPVLLGQPPCMHAPLLRGETNGDGDDDFAFNFSDMSSSVGSASDDVGNSRKRTTASASTARGSGCWGAVVDGVGVGVGVSVGVEVGVDVGAGADREFLRALCIKFRGVLE